nr:MAG TPA: hypothetical protein [Caudoviricetes sp.]
MTILSHVRPPIFTDRQAGIKRLTKRLFISYVA